MWRRERWWIASEEACESCGLLNWGEWVVSWKEMDEWLILLQRCSSLDSTLQCSRVHLFSSVTFAGYLNCIRAVTFSLKHLVCWDWGEGSNCEIWPTNHRSATCFAVVAAVGLWVSPLKELSECFQSVSNWHKTIIWTGSHCTYRAERDHSVLTFRARGHRSYFECEAGQFRLHAKQYASMVCHKGITDDCSSFCFYLIWFP